MNKQLIPIGEVAIRLALAVAAGTILGLNRWLHRKAAGIRTHALVSLGAALATLLIILERGSDAQALSRVIQGLLTGVGFIGAGVIMHLNLENKIQGLTTAATIWAAAILGIASGIADYRVVALGVLFAIFILVAGKQFEDLMSRAIRPGKRKGLPPPPPGPEED